MRAPAVAEAAGVSVASVYNWWRRYRQKGLGGLHDRSCRPRHSPSRCVLNWKLRSYGFAGNSSWDLTT